MKKGGVRSELTEEQREFERARDRWHTKMRDRGTPAHILPHEYAHAISIIKRARQTGMTHARIAEHCGVDASQVAKHDAGIYKTMNRRTYEALKTLRPQGFVTRLHETRGKIPDGAYVPLGFAVARRLRALRMVGFPSSFLGTQLGTTMQACSALARGVRDTCYMSTYQDVCALYEKYKDQDPEDCGVTKFGAMRARQHAVQQQWAGPNHWDDSWYDDEGVFHGPAIDDPQAFPDWTGECGTVSGYNLHLKYGTQVKSIPRKGHAPRRTVLCRPCLDAKAMHTSARPRDIDRAAMFAALDAGRSVRAIAEDFHCTTRTVMRYRKEWADADE